MLTQIRSIPLLKLKECVFPADSVARFFLQSHIASRSFRIEDDQCFTKGDEGTSNDVGDALLRVFLSSDCDAIILSTVEEVSFRGLTNFIQEWRRSPRQFSQASFVRSERFDNDSHIDLLPSTIYPFCKSDLVLRAQLDSDPTASCLKYLVTKFHHYVNARGGFNVSETVMRALKTAF
ncbi:unnamed protein product [Heligmosomoides polygyrus]|uniref:SAWADEE domain-containing protein n=1 Tax=Heligmosomoides polygyrus TaxID=6339 RepID=A0A183F9K0_HELPZ|nr:unnamed protein product [Heligmosomoides polygyrus]